MATYTELHELHSNINLLSKIDVSLAKAAHVISSEDSGTANNANRLIWAKAVSGNIRGASKQFLPLVLAANSGATIEQITGASDASIQANIDSFINLFATGE